MRSEKYKFVVLTLLLILKNICLTIEGDEDKARISDVTEGPLFPELLG